MQQVECLAFDELLIHVDQGDLANDLARLQREVAAALAQASATAYMVGTAENRDTAAIVVVAGAAWWQAYDVANKRLLARSTY